MVYAAEQTFGEMLDGILRTVSETKKVLGLREGSNHGGLYSPNECHNSYFFSMCGGLFLVQHNMDLDLE